MSHISKMQTQIVLLDCLIKSLEELGMNPVAHEQAVMIQGVGSHTSGEVLFTYEMPGRSRTLGFKFQEDGTYALVGDFWMLPETADEILAKINQRYAYNVTVEQLTQQGFVLSGEETAEDGTIRMTMARI